MNIRKLSLLYCALLITSAYTIIAMDEENKIEAAMEVAINQIAYEAITLRAIEDIHEIAATIAQEAKERDGTWVELGKEAWPTPNPCFYRTIQGLFLAVNRYPTELHTPFGQVKIYGGGAGKHIGFVSLFEAFKVPVRIAFVKNTHEKSKEEGLCFYKYDPINNKNIEIPREQLDEYRGSDTLIISNYRYPSIYKVVSVNGNVLPEPQYTNPLSTIYGKLYHAENGVSS